MDPWVLPVVFSVMVLVGLVLAACLIGRRPTAGMPARPPATAADRTSTVPAATPAGGDRDPVRQPAELPPRIPFELQ